MTNEPTFDRRTALRRLGVTTGALALAGCLGGDDAGDDSSDDADTDADDDLETTPEFFEIEDPPDAVYVPTHREAMRMLEPLEAGDYVLAPMLSYPHPFWVIAGGDSEDEVERVDPEDGRGVHMMFTLWDRETETVLPVDEGVQIRIAQDGDQIGSPFSPWPMLSQEMGFHFGDNVALPGDGTYTVEVTLPPISTRKTGDLEGRLDERQTLEFEFVYDDEFRHEVIGGVDYLDEEHWGQRGALEPMDHGHDEEHDESHDEDHGEHEGDHGDHDGHDDHSHDDGHDDHDHGEHDDSHDHDHGEHDDSHDHDHGEHDDSHDHDGHHHVPYSELPPVDAFPGTLLESDDGDADADELETRDLPRSGDAAFLVTLLESDSRLADGEQYLLVSPRTPYNRVPLADMSLSATVEQDGEATDRSLEQTLDGEYGLHYGVSLESALEADTPVTITVESPPQVARHRGYETAFLEMDPLEFVVPGEVDNE
ncbi:DUF7350 domain-containing protein [Natronolimnobius baerhuensis]|uniref:DUF7350 domain-containing protein n=1 Tax=Natronolimnobius baerhuensis TaxID=253108 RepID=A0A202EDN3_9EURY|nr:hypothetical protein [Natronolimnobius baerhuensis]OVE86298.1 hypothetical protein B2G88_05830 [Natronolimnobius baerhuensis]